MADNTSSLDNRPAWVDIASMDTEATSEFYAQLLGWDVQVSPDPAYGGYAMAVEGGVGVAGIGPQPNPETPSAWQLYIGTSDIDALATAVAANGGTVVMAPFDVGDQGRMAVFQDPSGAFFSAWQALQMRGFVTDTPGAFTWAELNARGVGDVLPFYERVFGWTVKSTDMGPDQPPYHEFQKDGRSILGAWEMSSMVPAEVPSYWQIYFEVDDVDAAFARALELGANEMLSPQDIPGGGRFAICLDRQGASFGLLESPPAD
jgi:predicted enzyme related to lactoylglutathione lyase